MPKASSIEWTREHALIALNLYGKLPFGKFDQTNRVIIEVASRMGRSPGSLAMKLGNLASLDPIHKARGVRGLSRTSKQDRDLWIEFQTNINTLAPNSEQLLHDLFTKDNNEEVDFLQRGKIRLEPSLKPPLGPTETTASVRVRRGQQFLRQTVLNSYEVRCCITGINVPRLLVASHIKPWRNFPEERHNPRNGLCLSSIHDAAFDDGLITLDKRLCLILSKRLTSYFPQAVLEQSFVPFEGKEIHLPKKVAEPDPSFLRYHRDVIFSKRN
jgi:putative restriction endonuclease